MYIARTESSRNPRALQLEHLEELWQSALVEHLAAASPKFELYQLIFPAVWDNTRVRLARVRFGRHRFDFDVGGRWAFVIPEYDGEDLSDFGAYAVADDRLRASYRTNLTATGLEESIWDAHYSPENILDLHFSPICWILSGYRGALPICWRKMAALILKDGYVPRGWLIEDAVRAEDELHNYCRLPPTRSHEEIDG